MAEILKEWLTERLQQTITWDAEEFGEVMKNGHVVASVLLSYHVINDEQFFLIRDENEKEYVKNNWKYLNQWLREIEINLSDTELTGIMEGRGSLLLRLFYQLFLSLDKRDRTNFLKKERRMVSNIVDKLNTRFKIESVLEKDVEDVEDLSRPMLDENHFIEWQRKKAEQVRNTYDFMRHRYSKMIEKIEDSRTPLKFDKRNKPILASKVKVEMDKFSLRFPCKFENCTYEDLLKLEQKSQDRKQSLLGTDWAKNYIENLQTKMHKKSDSEEFQKQLGNDLSGSLWDMSITEEENKLDSDLAKKVLKLSQFEKQMCTQIMETKQQARNLLKNRINAEKEYAEQREQQFNLFMDNVKEQISLENDELTFEKKRQNMLHQKLYSEKMKRKRQHYYEICYDTMLSLVDYATKYAHFKLLIGNDIPDHFIHEWKLLFLKKQRIFDILEPVENILKEPSLEEAFNEEEEEIIHLELDRQNALNECEFFEYHNCIGPWTPDSLIPNYDPESEDRKYEYLGTRVLGHIVYSLLEMKYPYPPLQVPADLPEFSVKVILCGLPDRAIIGALQNLLNFKKICVVRTESAINFCLKAFKTEMIGCTDIEISFDKILATTQSEENKDLIKLVKAEDENLNKSNDLLFPGPIPVNAKITQTPKTIPEEEMVLSTPANLGRYCYEAFSSGDTLTDHLLVAMIIEYIKEQQDISGFVIINYPNSYREAQIMEELFSGRSPPDQVELDDDDDIYLEESLVKHRPKEKDEFRDFRISKLVNDPHKRKIDTPFESYFTSFIKLKPTDDILQEVVVWDLTRDNSEFIERFYAVLGLNYSMYYEIIDKDLLAQICKYVIGDLSLPEKCNDSLFGYNVLSLLDFHSSDDKRLKLKTVKPEVSSTNKSRERLKRGSKDSKNLLNNNNYIMNVPNSSDASPDDVATLEELAGELSESRSISIYEEIKLLAGEEDWVYGELPISEIIGEALANCWEQEEKTYIEDMQHLFLARRLQINCLVPYTRFIKDKMEQIITLPSFKQDYVSRFQKDYNDFEYDWRDINISKNEWHCRVKELQTKLYSICDERKLFAQQQRQALISDNWAMEELTTLVNTYISCMQTELNRSISTFQAFHDFYFAMIKRSPPNDRLSSKELTKVIRENEETSGGKKGGEDKVFRQLKLAFQELQLKNIEIDYSNNPFNIIFENNIKNALKIIKDTNDCYRSVISKEYSEIAKISVPVKKKDENTSVTSISPEEVFKHNALKCIEEWTMGVNGEMYRANLRMLMLQYRCYRDMKLFSDQIFKAFTEVQSSINTYYLNEINSVDRLCKYLQLAIENARRIPETLILEHDTLVIDPNILQIPPIEPPYSSGEIFEMTINYEFKISQLARLRTQTKIVAPTGIALQQSFIYLLQDFIFFGKESCEGLIFPDEWRKLDAEQVPKLVFQIFGETAYIDWRDFLIYCLNIPFPTIDELLDLRKKLRCCDTESLEVINRDEFIAMELWYEHEFDLENKHAVLRKNLVKHFLFELYEVAKDKMNYSAFLLAFCKSQNSIEGFAMALSMAVGKKVCYLSSECFDVVCELINKKKYRDDCLACANKCTEKFLNAVINRVINTCESTIIEELKYTESLADEKKGKKGKGINLKKKAESSSARLPKVQKSATNKTVQSAVDVKTKNICRPCEDVPIPEEKPTEMVIEEEIKIDVPQEDPNLVYSVSQKVIWNVLSLCLPWHFTLVPDVKVTPYRVQVEEVLHILEKDTDNGDIFVCKFLTDPVICKLLNKVKKFTALNIMEEFCKITK